MRHSDFMVGQLSFSVDFCNTQIERSHALRSPTVLLSGLDHPSGIAVDRTANVYFSKYLAKRVSILPVGSKTPTILFTAQSYPRFLSIDSKGNLYFIEGETCNGGARCTKPDIHKWKR